jgi:hypothetical protein
MQYSFLDSRPQFWRSATSARAGLRRLAQPEGLPWGPAGASQDYKITTEEHEEKAPAVIGNGIKGRTSRTGL